MRFRQGGSWQSSSSTNFIATQVLKQNFRTEWKSEVQFLMAWHEARSHYVKYIFLWTLSVKGWSQTFWSCTYHTCSEAYSSVCDVSCGRDWSNWPSCKRLSLVAMCGWWLYTLASWTAKATCDAFMELFSITGFSLVGLKLSTPTKDQTFVVAYK